MPNTLEYLPELRKIRAFMHTQATLGTSPAFPYSNFKLGAMLVSELILNEEDKRFLIPIFGCVIAGRQVPHAWNYDPENKFYVDIAADRFGKQASEIVIVNPESGIYKQYDDAKMERKISECTKTHAQKLAILFCEYNNHKKLRQIA